MTEALLSAGLIICFGFAYFAESAWGCWNYRYVLCGNCHCSNEIKEKIEQQVEPIANGVFVPFFFVSIGLAVSFDGIGDQVGFMVIFSVIAIFLSLLVRV